MNTNDGLGQLITLLVILGLWALRYWRPRWRGGGWAHGQAAWLSEREMRRAGMFSGKGLILGRTLRSRRRITVERFCHTLLVAPTGAGKSVGIIIPALLTYSRSCVCLDMKGDLFALTSSARKRMRQRIIDLAPFSGGKDKWNILDAVQPGPMLVDHARAIAESLVVRQGSEHEPHWNESAVIVIAGVIVFVAVKLKGPDRNLNAVREICANRALLDLAANTLIEMGGGAANVGHQIQGFEAKERSGVLSTVGRHLAFLDSELVAAAVATSTFDPLELCRPGPGATCFIRVPNEHREAQRNLLRLWLGALVRVIGGAVAEGGPPVLFLLDETSALGENFTPLQEALVRGRGTGAGIRLLLCFQSHSQMRAAFRDKPTLIEDNCDIRIHLGPPTGYEEAEWISKSIGDHTITVMSGGENESQSWQTAGHGENGGQMNRSWGRNFSEAGRALMKPEEILSMSTSYLIAFVRGMKVILARRVVWYADPMFGTAFWWPPPQWWLLVAACVWLAAWAMVGMR